MRLTEGIKQWIATTAWEFEQDKMLVYLAQQLGYTHPDEYGNTVKPSQKAINYKKEYGKWDPEGYDRTFKRITQDSYEVRSDGFTAPVKIERIKNNIYVNGSKMSADTTVEQVSKKLISLLGIKDTISDPITNISIILKRELMHIAQDAFNEKYVPLRVIWSSGGIKVGTRDFDNVLISIASTPTKFMIGSTLVDTLDPETIADIIKAEYDKFSQPNEFNGRAFSDLKKKFPVITKVSAAESNLTLFLEFDLSDEYSSMGLLHHWMIQHCKSAIVAINKILKSYNKSVDYIGRIGFDKNFGTIHLKIGSSTSSISGINKIYDEWKEQGQNSDWGWRYHMHKAIVEIFQ